MKSRILNKFRAYPMILLLLPLVAAILLCERKGMFYPPENVVYDSMLVHTFVLTGENRSTARCERFEARTYGGKVYAYILRDSIRSLPQAGDTLIATTRIRPIDSIGSFDYHTYLLRQGIVGSAFVHHYEIHAAEHHPLSWQKRLYLRLSDAGLTGDELATVGALTLGYKEDLDKELRHRFQASGAAHVLAVSGLHTGILYALLLWLLTLGGCIKPRYENQVGRCLISLFIILVMWAYAWLTGMTPSVVRAVLMVSLMEIGRMLYRDSLSLNSIAAAAVLILLVRPLDLWSVSFQLSFAATFAIVLVAKECEKIFHFTELNHRWYGRIISWLSGTIIISIAAQLGTLPLTMYYFSQISNYFLLTNLLVLPLAFILVPFGLVTVISGGTTFGLICGKISGLLAWIMNNAVGWIEALPGSTTQVSIGGGMVAVYYTMFLIFCFFFTKNN